MLIGEGDHRYEWIDHWARLPETKTYRQNGRTHGIAAVARDRVVVFCQADPAVLVFDAEGRKVLDWGDRFPGAHGLTVVEENDPKYGQTEFYWLTDARTCEVLKATPEGLVVLGVDRPFHKAYDRDLDGQRVYSPTWVAVNEQRWGGNGDIFVADGYGASLIHRYTSQGKYIRTLDGSDGAGPFKCPHGVAFRPPGHGGDGEPELYVADRGNKRVQVFDAEGTFKRVVGEGVLHSPCGFDFHDGLTLVPELFGRVTLLDADDRLVTTLGDNPDIHKTEGWPNLPADQIHPGKFNSPHDACFDADGNIFVVEWIIGGRITKLVKQ